jgi:hypothetical protein
MKPTICACLGLLALVGCAATGIKVTDEQLAAFKNGTTTEAEVVAKLGVSATGVIRPLQSRRNQAT